MFSVFLFYLSELSLVNVSSASRIPHLFPPTSQRKEEGISYGSSTAKSIKFQNKKCVPHNLIISDKNADEFALRTLKIEAAKE